MLNVKAKRNDRHNHVMIQLITIFKKKKEKEKKGFQFPNTPDSI